MVGEGGGGAPAVAGGGAVKGLCSYMQAHADVRQCAVLAYVPDINTKHGPQAAFHRLLPPVKPNHCPRLINTLACTHTQFDQIQCDTLAFFCLLHEPLQGFVCALT